MIVFMPQSILSFALAPYLLILPFVPVVLRLKFPKATNLSHVVIGTLGCLLSVTMPPLIVIQPTSESVNTMGTVLSWILY